MGPLAGITVIELAGIGPGPFCGMMLADLGADVIRVDRAQSVQGGDPERPPPDLLARGSRSIGVDLKSPDGVEVVLSFPVERADALIEGSRPGVTERLGLGPDDCLARQPLAGVRYDGLGQDGPYASTAGHDINYISLAGALIPSAGAGRRRSRPSTWSAISAACCWPSASWPAY